MKRVFVPLLVLVLLLGLVPAAMAAPHQDDTLIEAGEVVNNDVVVLEGDIEIQEGAVVNGDVTVFNGDAFVDGRVTGSLTLFNGDLAAGPAADITGECVLLNGDIDADELAALNCTTIENLNLDEIAPFFENAPGWFKTLPAIPGIPAIPTIPPIPTIEPLPTLEPLDPIVIVPPAPVKPVMPVYGDHDDGSGIGRVAGGLFGALTSAFFAGLLGLVVGAAVPDHLRQISRTAREKPVTSGAAGILTAIAVPSLIALLIPLSIVLTLVCIGLLGFPLMLLLALGLVVGMLLGWVVVGTVFGERFLNRDKRRSTAWTAALGTAVMTLLVGLLGVLSGFIGGLASFVIGSIGLGAVALTWFGTKSYPRRPASGTGTPEDPNKVQVVLDTLPPDEKLAPER